MGAFGIGMVAARLRDYRNHGSIFGSLSSKATNDVTPEIDAR